MELLFMDPVFKEAIWGGTKLRDVFDYEIPSDTTGECWAISGHANGMSHVAGGRFDGKTLGELWKEEPEIFGNYPGSQVPLLIKIIDAKNDLSIQVHPDDAYAGEHENGCKRDSHRSGWFRCSRTECRGQAFSVWSPGSGARDREHELGNLA